MIYTQSLISGCRAVLSTFVVHIAMLLAILFFVRVPSEPFLTEVNIGDNANLE